MGSLFEFVERKFEAMGARAVLRPPENPRLPWQRPREPQPLVLNVARDRHGEYFDVQVDASRVELQVLDVRPRDRHLLLMSRREGTKEKFLCGHDERAWFVAAVPGRNAYHVPSAIEAPKPFVFPSPPPR